MHFWSRHSSRVFLSLFLLLRVVGCSADFANDGVVDVLSPTDSVYFSLGVYAAGVCRQVGTCHVPVFVQN